MSSNLPRLRNQVAWNGKTLVVTDPETIVALRRPALSASTSKSMQSCAARWAGERLLRNEKEDPFDPAPLGTAAHAVLEDFYALDGAQRTMARAHSILLQKAEDEWPDDPDAEEAVRDFASLQKLRWVRDVKNAYQGIFVSETPALVNVFGLELKIENIEVAGVPIVGYIDRISEVIKNGITGLQAEDYKSGKMPDLSSLKRFGDDHGDQLRVYTEAVHVMEGVKPIGAKVIYTKFGKDREVDISRTAMDKTLKVFADSWGRHNRYMDAASFPTKTGALCGWCPLVNSCHVAKEAGYAASPKMAGKLPSASALGIPSLRPGITPWPIHTTSDMRVPDYGNTVTFFAPEPDTQTSTDEHSPAVIAIAASAHMKSSGETRKTEEQEIQMASNKDNKPWDERVDGELNPNSYIAGAIFTLTTMAVENLSTADLPITGLTVKALAATYKHVLLEAQNSWTGSYDFDDVANVRMRAALFTVLRTLPQPWGQDAAAWDAWVLAAIKRCRAITAVAFHLYEGEIAENPWHQIADVAPITPVPEVKAKAPARTRATKVTAPKVAPAPQAATEPEPAPVAEVIPEVVVPEPSPAVVKPAVDDFAFPSEDDFSAFADDFDFAP